MTDDHKGCDYRLSDADAEMLKGASVLPHDIRAELVRRYVDEHGCEALVSLFAQFIGLANSVVANNREMVDIILLSEGIGHPDRNEDRANLPTIFGALAGVPLANAVDDAKTCQGCAYRLGSAANQSPTTTDDAEWCQEGDRDFMCHEDLDDKGAPKHLCRGHAQAARKGKRRAA